MAVKFRKVKRKILAGTEKDKVKTFAVAKATGVCDMEKLCKLISGHSTVSSGDVKAVLDALNWAMDLELQSGNIVQVGELGNFRFSVSSEGTETEKDFNASKIKRAHLVFSPGKSLRGTRDDATFALEDVKEVKKEAVPEPMPGSDDDVIK